MLLWKLLMKSWLSYMMLCKKSLCGFFKFNYVFKHLDTIQLLPLVSSISILATSWRRQYLWCPSAVWCSSFYLLLILANANMPKSKIVSQNTNKISQSLCFHFAHSIILDNLSILSWWRKVFLLTWH